MASPPLLVQPFDVCHQQGAAEHKANRRARAEQAALATVVQRHTSQFPEVPPETIQQAVRGVYDEYDNSAIRDFVPILVERAVRAELHRA